MTAVLHSSSATPPPSGDTTPAVSPSAAAANAAAASFATLTDSLDYLDASSIEQVRQAYRFADEAHLGQLRNSGEPYITHPIAVAAQCASWKLDAQALMAALLHDAMEDCGVTKADLIDRFGSKSATIEGSANIIGIKDPAVDALLDKVTRSTTRAELSTALRALDRVLRFDHYVVPHWYSGAHRVAYWANRFQEPAVKPLYYQPEGWVLSTWWAQPGK